MEKYKLALEKAIEVLKIYANSKYFEREYYEAIIDSNGCYDPIPKKVITFSYDENIAKNIIKEIEELIK